MSGSRVAAAIALVGLVGIVAAAAVTAGDERDEGSVATATTPDGGAGDERTDESVAAEPEPPEPTRPTIEPTEPGPDLPDRGVHPELVEIDGWLQSEVTSLEELRGDVVAVQFWTFGCRNCRATLPHMQQLYADHREAGFEIVGIHAPEFSFEAEVDNIVEAAADLGVTWPIALDTDKRTFHSWQEGTRAFWPRIYLLDRNGHIRYDHIGEGRYDEIDAAVRALLAEPA